MRLAFHFVYGSTTVTLSPVDSRCDHRVRGGRADLGLIIGHGLFNESNSIGALMGPPWNILLHTPRHLDRRAERRRRPRAAGPPMGHVGVRGRTGRAGGGQCGRAFSVIRLRVPRTQMMHSPVALGPIKGSRRRRTTRTAYILTR